MRVKVFYDYFDTEVYEFPFDKREVIDTLEESIPFLDEEINLPDDSFWGKDKNV